MKGLMNRCSFLAWRNPARSDVARVASTTMVRPGSMGVACVSTTEPLPSPSMMVMTMERGSGLWKVASVSATTRPMSLLATRTLSTSSSRSRTVSVAKA